MERYQNLIQNTYGNSPKYNAPCGLDSWVDLDNWRYEGEGKNLGINELQNVLYSCSWTLLVFWESLKVELKKNFLASTSYNNLYNKGKITDGTTMGNEKKFGRKVCVLLSSS